MTDRPGLGTGTAAAAATVYEQTAAAVIWLAAESLV